MSTVRRPRWYPPPPPTPKILNIPRRTRRKVTKQVIGKPVIGKESDKNSSITTTTTRRCYRGKLESLFDQERVFSRTVPIVLFNSGVDCERRERVEEIDFRDRRITRGDKDDEDVDYEKWRFQTEILRAECNFLRMERDIALKKLELNRVQTKRTLRSAVETLVSGKEKITEGRNAGSVLEEEIGDLEEKLKELQRNSGVRDFEFRKCSNFDKEASVLQRRLEKLGEGLLSEEKCVKEIREMAEASLTIKTCRKFDQSFSPDREIRFKDVRICYRELQF
ncbi:myosin-like protein [Thalictrum thalictroides]|uniref:Myosin-like protein n=1 Tax=Thalictrum thalictroides TaxID=46969 RepID=A0A7J6WN97_THATH|nr:myosin-like protein [Thalictrum thalictroides]